MWDEQPADDAPGPPVEVDLADGQTVQAALIQRRQERDGTWWFRVSLVGIWTKNELPNGTVRAEPDDIVFDAPAHAVHPRPGLERAYADVPTWRHPTWLRRRHRALPRHAPPAPWDAPFG